MRPFREIILHDLVDEICERNLSQYSGRELQSISIKKIYHLGSISVLLKYILHLPIESQQTTNQLQENKDANVKRAY